MLKYYNKEFIRNSCIHRWILIIVNFSFLSFCQLHQTTHWSHQLRWNKCSSHNWRWWCCSNFLFLFFCFLFLEISLSSCSCLILFIKWFSSLSLIFIILVFKGFNVIFFLLFLSFFDFSFSLFCNLSLIIVNCFGFGVSFFFINFILGHMIFIIISVVEIENLSSYCSILNSCFKISFFSGVNEPSCLKFIFSFSYRSSGLNSIFILIIIIS